MENTQTDVRGLHAYLLLRIVASAAEPNDPLNI